MSTSDRPDGSDQLGAVTIQVLQQFRRHPVSSRRLHKDVARAADAYRPARLDALLDELRRRERVTVFPDGPEVEYFWTANFTQLKDRLCALLRSHHAQHPYDPGVASGDIRRRFADGATMNAQRNIDLRLFELTLNSCRTEGLIEESEFGLRLTGFRPAPRQRDDTRALEERILRYAQERFCGRLEASELSCALGRDVEVIRSTVTALLRSGRLIKLARLYPVKEDRFLCASTVEEARIRVAEALHERGRLSTSDVRILLGQSRSTTIPLLEYFDRIGFTRRDGDYREAGPACRSRRASEPSVSSDPS